MRTIVISLLLATVAASPAIAGPRDRDESQPQTREERQQARQERRESQARPERTQRPAIAAPRELAQPQQSNDAAVQRRRQLDPADAQAWRERRQQQVVQNRQPVSTDTLRQSDRPIPNVMRPRTRTPVVSDSPRPGTQPARRIERRRTPEVRWSGNWRNDNRYDWRRWRERNRVQFHLGSYYDPFGWGYQPYSIGWRLWPSYYSNRYWINDPWAYRLPYAPPGYRWVRYWDDALLVDTWSGEVVDVIRNFFW